ncbi:MAG: nickel-responsive transcriptional regulator NikR [Pirellulales bacterium]|nr:nickel-responsive transcriptional regulator NikR [Pirellulales bacterium]
MSDIVRFTISVEKELLDAFEHFVQQGKFATRSEAVRQLMHEALTRQFCKTAVGEASGILTLVYDHHRTQVQRKLIQLQHENVHCVLATLHVHLDHDHCMEAIALRGKPDVLENIASSLRGIKGVAKGELVMATVDR